MSLIVTSLISESRTILLRDSGLTLDNLLVNTVSLARTGSESTAGVTDSRC
jgi:hypothetical protein